MTIKQTKMYSQRDEEKHILFHTPDKGRFLDIGAYHPYKFSNTRALYENQWEGVYVEPSPQLMSVFEEEYSGEKGIHLYAKCVGDKDGNVIFHDSGGDAVGTTVKEEAHKWKAQGAKFTQITVPMVTVRTMIAEFISLGYGTKFDFINIDTEGNVLDILKQFDFDFMKTKCLCVEWNSQNIGEYHQHVMNQGFSLVHKTPENLIYAR